MFEEGFNPLSVFSVKGDTTLWNSFFIEDGASACLLDSAQVDGIRYDFTRFDLISVYSEIARNAQNDAEKHVKNINKVKNGSKCYRISDEPNNLWKCFGYTFISTIFSYMALEARINRFLPDKISIKQYADNPELEKIPNESGIITLKGNLERQCSTFDKLFIIYPIFNKVSRNKLNNHRNNFKYLEFIRNKLVHLKSNDIRTHAHAEKVGEVQYKKFWNRIMPNLKSKKLRFLPYNIVSSILIELNAHT